MNLKLGFYVFLRRISRARLVFLVLSKRRGDLAALGLVPERSVGLFLRMQIKIGMG